MLDLIGVLLVDRAGEELLSNMLESGTAVRAEGVWMRHLVKELRDRLSSQATLPSRRTPRLHQSPGAF